MRRVISILLVIILASSLLVGCGDKITLEQYKQIETGMSYEKVVEILGQGEEVSSSEVSDIKTTMYQWINSDGSNISVTLQNEKVVSKAQAGLK